MSAPVLLTVSELAVVLRKSRWTVNRLVKEGRLPFQPVEGLGVRQFRRSEVEAYVGCRLELEDLQAAS